MRDIWFISDTHFGHANILKFAPEGKKLRPFETLDDMHKQLIENWNSVVKPHDRVYHLGDFSMNPAYIEMMMPQLNGKTVLIKGNHDKGGMGSYVYHFEDVRACHELTVADTTFILTHIPVHPDSLIQWKDGKARWKGNIHGHTHSQTIDDPRYMCVSVEQINYTPIHIDDVLKYFGVEKCPS